MGLRSALCSFASFIQAAAVMRRSDPAEAAAKPHARAALFGKREEMKTIVSITPLKLQEDSMSESPIPIAATLRQVSSLTNRLRPRWYRTSVLQR